MFSLANGIASVIRSSAFSFRVSGGCVGTPAASEPGVKQEPSGTYSRLARSAAAAAQPAEKLAPKRLLLLGWNPQMPDLLAQIDEVSPAGSTITILSEAGAGPPATAASALRRCRLEQVEADPTRVEDLRQMQLGKIDSILILQEGDGGEGYVHHCLLSHSLRKMTAIGTLYFVFPPLQWPLKPLTKFVRNVPGHF